MTQNNARKKRRDAKKTTPISLQWDGGRLWLESAGTFDRRQEREWANWACCVIQALAAFKWGGEFVVRLIHGPKMKQLNRQFLHHDYDTDVLAFGYPHSAKNSELSPRADLYISIDRARRQAAEFGHTTEQEIALLIVHGLLHVAGYDDHSPKERKRMFLRTRQLFNRYAPHLAPRNLDGTCLDS